MRIYFSGIGGVGIGPLAEISLDAGYDIVGSDPVSGLMTDELTKRGIQISQDQSGDFLRTQHDAVTIDWFVCTSALPADHPELTLAHELGIKVAKRDELLACIIDEKNLKLIAVAGTHGKTTTTGMMVWTLKQLGIPVSYSVGTTLSWGPSGKFDPRSKYFVYECDEFDRNFLHFTPYLSIITSIEWDHPDTYPLEQDYFDAFLQFAAQSQQVITWQSETAHVAMPGDAWVLGGSEVQNIQLVGKHNRRNATLVAKGIEYLQLVDRLYGKDEVSANTVTSFSEDSAFPAAARQDHLKLAPSGSEEKDGDGVSDNVTTILSAFPGTNRRFEKLANNLYTDYGHTPSEIAATLQMARELSSHVMLIYQPHQNIRQHEIHDQYTDAIFADASEVYWLPTYLSRENPDLETLTPEQLTKNLNPPKLHLAELDDSLWNEIQTHLSKSHLVLCMGAGTIDGWVRNKLTKSS